jgi:hypothetical protein
MIVRKRPVEITITVTTTDRKENMRMRAKRFCTGDVAILMGESYEVMAHDVR